MLLHTLAFRKSSQVCADLAFSELFPAMELQHPFLIPLPLNGTWLAFFGGLFMIPMNPFIRLLHSS